MRGEAVRQRQYEGTDNEAVRARRSSSEGGAAVRGVVGEGELCGREGEAVREEKQ
jgi:hypothetical protein